MKIIFYFFLCTLSFQNLMAQEVPDKANEDVQIDFTQIDPVVPQPQLMEALQFLEENQDEFSNQKYLVLIDYAKISSKKRFFLVNLKTGKVESRLTSHGKGSEDGENTKRAVKFSNKKGSEATSLGFFKTAETYTGQHGHSLKLDGLSKSNSNARERAIVVHAADYVIESMPHAGRSQGCPALDPKHAKRIIEKIKGGALMYSFVSKEQDTESASAE